MDRDGADGADTHAEGAEPAGAPAPRAVQGEPAGQPSQRSRPAAEAQRLPEAVNVRDRGFPVVTQPGVDLVEAQRLGAGQRREEEGVLALVRALDCQRGDVFRMLVEVGTRKADI